MVRARVTQVSNTSGRNMKHSGGSVRSPKQRVSGFTGRKTLNVTTTVATISNGTVVWSRRNGTPGA